MFTGDSLLFSIVFGLIGSAYLTYGKRTQRLGMMVTGVALIAFPYFVSNPFAEFGIGVALALLPLWLGV